MKNVGSVLDLPLEKQKELAIIEGLTHSEWVKETKKEFAENKKFIKKIKEYGQSLTPEQKAAEIKKNAHMQDKIDSGNPR